MLEFQLKKNNSNILKHVYVHIIGHSLTFPISMNLVLQSQSVMPTAYSFPSWPTTNLSLCHGILPSPVTWLTPWGRPVTRIRSAPVGTTRRFGGDTHTHTPLPETHEGVLGLYYSRLFSLYFQKHTNTNYQQQHIFQYLQEAFHPNETPGTFLSLQDRLKGALPQSHLLCNGHRLPGAEGFKEQGKDVVICHLEIESGRNMKHTVDGWTPAPPEMYQTL